MMYRIIAYVIIFLLTGWVGLCLSLVASLIIPFIQHTLLMESLERDEKIHLAEKSAITPPAPLARKWTYKKPTREELLADFEAE